MSNMENDREFKLDESSQATRDIENLARILGEIAVEEIIRKNKLIENPNGFLFDRSGYCCSICDRSAPEGNSWYDKYGLKCMLCQKAMNDKIIPGSVATNKESWYSKTELEMFFNIKGAVLSKYIKQSLLQNRDVLNEKGKVHFQIFLIKDNKDVLPPKKYLKSRIVKEMRRGEEWFTSEFWYEYIDLDLLKKLVVKYRIFGFLPETFSKPISNGRFYWKKRGSILTPKGSDQ
jgi:hypothetical protein